MRKCATPTSVVTDLNHNAVPLWEGACPMAVYQSEHLILTHRHRGQAPSHICFCGVHKCDPKLWKTNLATSQSATYSRRKSLFCHSFDLSPSAVEPAVGNVGVAG